MNVKIGFLGKVLNSMRYLISPLVLTVLMSGVVIAATPNMPSLTGKLVFHRYSSYDALDSQLFMYDFATHNLTNISQNWPVTSPMNAAFSPDGQWMTFMGVPQTGGNSWDVYLWQVNSTNPPINLTAGNQKRNEDPKFMSDNSRIVFKQNGDLKMMNKNGSLLNSVTNDGWVTEQSMPYQFYGTSTLLYAEGAGASSMIYSIDQSGALKTQLSAKPGLQEFYPVSWLSDRFLYVRWYSRNNQNNQIYTYNLSTRAVAKLSFNSDTVDTSDPAPIDNRYLIVSRFSQGATSGYDLYIADTQSTNVWPLTNLNSTLEELGSNYHP